MSDVDKMLVVRDVEAMEPFPVTAAERRQLLRNRAEKARELVKCDVNSALEWSKDRTAEEMRSVSKELFLTQFQRDLFELIAKQLPEE